MMCKDNFIKRSKTSIRATYGTYSNRRCSSPRVDNREVRSVFNFDILKMHFVRIINLKSSETVLPRSYERNLLLRRETWKNFSGLQRALNPRPRDTGATLQPTELWSHWRWELIISRFTCSRDKWNNERNSTFMKSIVHCMMYIQCMMAFISIINLMRLSVCGPCTIDDYDQH